jgi:hypothetical protein
MRIIIVCLLLMAATASAQNFGIDWFTIDGGGGASVGGAFSVSGTIGQPDAGVMTGGDFTVVGGFWAWASEALYLSISNSPAGVVVYWDRSAAGFVLDESPVLGSPPPQPWTQVPFPYETNATHIYITVPAPVANKFYRLRRP